MREEKKNRCGRSRGGLRDLVAANGVSEDIHIQTSSPDVPEFLRSSCLKKKLNRPPGRAMYTHGMGSACNEKALAILVRKVFHARDCFCIPSSVDAEELFHALS